ncbi:MAG: hypothetical protein N2D54_10065, partial [Chloroflexota bacterium]
MKLFSKENTALHNAMQSNALFSDISGLGLIIASQSIASITGIPSATALAVLGSGLLAWALVIFFQTQKPAIPPAFTIAVIAGDLLWVVGSAFLIIGNQVALTTTGKWAVGII